METDNLFYKILEDEKIHTLFQPIVRLRDGDIIGYECLSRGPEGSDLYSPLSLIEAARSENKLWELETVFRKSAVKAACENKIDKMLFINVEPNIINDPKFKEGFTKDYIKSHNILPEQIIFEITERSAAAQFENFSSVIQHYKEQGYKIAIDDTGAGYSNFAILSKISPYYIKIDMELIRGIDKDFYKKAIINAFVTLAKLTGTRLVAEGIETKEELETLIKLGVYAGQGYYIGKPSKEICGIDENIREKIISAGKSSDNNFNLSSICIGNICKQIKAFDDSVHCMEIKEYFEKTKDDGVCLLKSGHVAGLIMRNHLYAKLSGQYGFSLYANKPAARIMDSDCLIVDYHTPVMHVSEMAMLRPCDKVYDSIIVTKDAKYYGIVTVIELLSQYIKIEKKLALELNPLTGLPGNIRINCVLRESIEKKKQASILYIDLDNFKAYNDIYGFEKGDHVIKMTKDVIVNNLNAGLGRECFIGHIGGDDFVALIECDSDECEEICREIIRDFDSRIAAFFNDADRKNGYIYGRGRGNVTRKFPLTSISIGALCCNMGFFKTPEELAQFMSKLKKKAKKTESSSYVIEKYYPPNILQTRQKAI